MYGFFIAVFIYAYLKSFHIIPQPFIFHQKHNYIQISTLFSDEIQKKINCA